ncbi:hypothetical protein [Streptomyces minutiscleroticus]|uniref:Uncharacterized protein n=1 Tax=Streptomyces minutiscleroticus TaxID=68238 RepID=A0A918U4F2_9ACTN|nr:hypothetical protein [Streptomyces minutiscleroticus]GGX89822.1 hypothetical protein GCM10010358_49730 [Streptomyces minutiscleroticus]
MRMRTLATTGALLVAALGAGAGTAAADDDGPRKEHGVSDSRGEHHGKHDRGDKGGDHHGGFRGEGREEGHGEGSGKGHGEGSEEGRGQGSEERESHAAGGYKKEGGYGHYFNVGGPYGITDSHVAGYKNAGVFSFGSEYENEYGHGED